MNTRIYQKRYVYFVLRFYFTPFSFMILFSHRNIANMMIVAIISKTKFTQKKFALSS